jgi:hypothetical protein
MTHLDDVRRELEGLLARPADGRADAEEIEGLIGSLYAATRAGEQPAALDMIREAQRSAAADSTLQRLLAHAYLTAQDAEFRSQQTDTLSIERVISLGSVDYSSPTLAIRIRPSPDESIIVSPTDPDETAQFSLLGIVQVFVPNELPEEEATRPDSRGFDDYGLSGAVQAQYRMRLIRRAAWGVASLTLTNRRIIGVIYDDNIPGAAETTERAFRPMAMVADGDISVIAFACDRTSFEDHAIATGLGQSRTPTVHLDGEAAMVVLPLRTFGPGGMVTKLGKDQVANAIQTFVGENPTAASDPDSHLGAATGWPAPGSEIRGIEPSEKRSPRFRIRRVAIVGGLVLVAAAAVALLTTRGTAPLSAERLSPISIRELCSSMPTSPLSEWDVPSRWEDPPGIGDPPTGPLQESFGAWACMIDTQGVKLQLTVLDLNNDEIVNWPPQPQGPDGRTVALDGVADKAWVITDPGANAPVQVAAISGDVGVVMLAMSVPGWAPADVDATTRGFRDQVLFAIEALADLEE